MIKLTLKFSFQTPFISAASGLATDGKHFYLISDDELKLYSLPVSLQGAVSSVTLLPGALPEEAKARKKLKPDFESLCFMDEETLIAIPSGSKPNRMKGVLVNVKSHNTRTFDLTRIYSHLLKTFPELNIEGSLVHADDIVLFQRGNGERKENALIRLPLRSFLSDLPESISIKKFELGTINSAALSFTDACLVNGMIYFLAAGERTESTYLDGEFAGAILGKMTLEGEILEKEVLPIDHKPEGIAFYKGSFYFVTDADDRSKASSLLSASF